DGRGRLDPDRLGEPTIVPPVGEAPGHDVLARAPRWVVDADRDRVDLVGHHRVRRIKGERGRAALVVAEPAAVQPDVRDVIDGAEFQRDGLVLPFVGDIEVFLIAGHYRRHGARWV